MTEKIKYFICLALGLIRFLPVVLPTAGLSSNAIATEGTAGQIEVYFTPGRDCENNIIQRMNAAQKIDIAVYAITNRRIVDAIIAASARGAEIRIITDRLQAAGKGSLVPELRGAGLSVRTNIKHKIEHNKFAIFDNAIIISGSYNWTSAASDKNSENCIFFPQPDGRPFGQRFQYLWELYDG
jgi:phosphatidylserine/phosphatidylglycerophosphate/cardiolipin synthase-like enzyme